MKKLISTIFFGIFIIFPILSFGQKIIIKGTVSGPWEGHSIGMYNNITSEKAEVPIIDGKFTMEIPFSTATRYMFFTTYDTKVKKGYSPFGILVDKPTRINVKLDIEKGFATGAVVTGSKPHTIYTNMLKKYYETEDEAKRMEILSKSISNHPKSFAALFIMDRHGRDIPVQEREAIFSKLDSKFKSRPEWMRIEDKIAGDRSAVVGQLVKDFTLLTAENQKVNFSQFKGKYVYLNFWASWCGPCHAEFPALGEIYHTYKDKNFDILGVSTDKNHDAWLKDLKKINLPWTQVIDGQDAASVALKQFGVTALPTSFLIDPEGKIILKNIRVAQLEEELRKVLK